MSKPAKDKDFLKYPNFKGGKQALESFIKAKLIYPEDALDQKIEGAVMVSYTVNGLGKVIKAEIIRGIGHGCDEEALRLVKMLPYQKAVNKGFKTTSTKKITIHFKLPRKAKVADSNGVNLQYNIVKERKKGVSEKKSKEKTYTIKINYTSK